MARDIFSNNINGLAESILTKKVLKRIKEEEGKIGNTRILESDFIGIGEGYSEKDVERDMDEVLRLKKIFTANGIEETKEYADALEHVVSERIELDDWLGDCAHTYTTSVYDDYKNGVDSIVEFKDPTDDNEEIFDLSHVGLAFDFTYASDVTKKFEAIKKDLDNGKLSNIKYFASENSDYKGPINKIPRLIIGANRRTVDDLMELFLESKKPSSARKSNEISPEKKLETHYFQINMLKQMFYELTVFKEYSDKLKNKELSEKFDFFLLKIKKILIEKKKSGKILEDRNGDDEFLKKIGEICSQLFK